MVLDIFTVTVLLHRNHQLLICVLTGWYCYILRPNAVNDQTQRCSNVKIGEKVLSLTSAEKKLIRLFAFIFEMTWSLIDAKSFFFRFILMCQWRYNNALRQELRSRAGQWGRVCSQFSHCFKFWCNFDCEELSVHHLQTLVNARSSKHFL